MNYSYHKPFPLGPDSSPYRKLSSDYVSVEKIGSNEVLQIKPEALQLLAKEAFSDIAFYLRPTHLKQLGSILEDPEASDNDRFVAHTLLRNAVESAKKILPMCQDTGTATVVAKKGQYVWTEGDDAESLSQGIFQTYQERNLRYSLMAPLNMFDEKNTGNNLPAQIDIYSEKGNSYEFLFVAKGGGSANKFFLFQETKSLLNPNSLAAFIKDHITYLGTSACPPYHLAIVIGGTSAEAALKTCKLASTGYYDHLPSAGTDWGQAFRDLEWEQKVLQIARECGIGAQFGGKYFVHDVRVIRLPRHAASCPVAMGVSCSADRNIKGKITSEGIFLEELEKNPEKYLASQAPTLEAPIAIDLNQTMPDILKKLSMYPVKTRLNLSGPLIVARDIAHAKIKERLDRGEAMPDYFKKHPIYYAGPAKTPEGMPSGSFGPTTAGRMDGYVDPFMANGGSLISLAKGNRSPAVREACKKHGGFYLGSIGGPAAILAKENIRKVEVIDFSELGMEAVRKIEVVDFPAFIVCDDKGNDFYEFMKD